MSAMAVVVTRPEPDNHATALALEKRGFRPMLAPMLVYQALPFRDDAEARYSGAIVTSANALRSIAGHAVLSRLRTLPLFAVGAHTAKAAGDIGFTTVVAAGGDAISLRDAVMRSGIRARASAPWLYLAAADVSRDLAAELRANNVPVTTRQVYRMAMTDRFPPTVIAAFAQGDVDAVLHYSRRSAQGFVAAARQAGLEISALAPPQCCLSAPIAEVLREAGSARIVVADEPREEALLTALDLVAQTARPRA